MKRTWLIAVSVIALAGVVAFAQERPKKKKDEVALLREEVALLREHVRKLEARVKELEAIFEDDDALLMEPDAEAPSLTDLAGPDDLRRAFLAAADKPRLILFISPT